MRGSLQFDYTTMKYLLLAVVLVGFAYAFPKADLKDLFHAECSVKWLVFLGV